MEGLWEHHRLMTDVALLILFSRHTLMLSWAAATLALLALAFAAAWPTRWRAFFGWVLLYAAAHISFFQLIDVGPYIHLQLFRYWSDVLALARIPFLFVLFFQFAVVAWGCRHWYGALFSTARKAMTPGGVLITLALMVFSVVAFAPETVQALVKGGLLKQSISHATKAGFSFVAALAALLNLMLAVRAIPREGLERWSLRLRSMLQSPRFPWIAAGWTLVVASLLAWFVLDRIPHVPDEAAYIFHAKYLATGQLALTAPPVPDAIPTPFYFADEERWFLTPPAGWPFVLAVGFWVGAPWLVNPLLGALALLLAYRLLKHVYGVPLASGAVGLLALSPWFLFMNASLMTHPLTLVLFLLAMLGVLHAREHGTVLWAGVAGLAIGGILHIRPLDAILAALVCGGWWIAGGVRKLRVPAMIATAVGGVLMTALFLAYNRELTGDAMQAPINMFTDNRQYEGANRLGFGPDVGNFGWFALDPLPGHGPIDVVVNANQNLYIANFDLFGWAFGSLTLVFLLAGWSGRRRDILWWGTVVVMIAGLSLYWFSGGPDFGARYWYLLILPFVVLTWRGAEDLALRLRNAGTEPASEARVWAFVVLASVLGTSLVIPWRSIDKYKYYRGTRPDFRALIQQTAFGQDLVFVRGRPMPDFVSVSQFNPPRFDRDAPGPLFVMDLGPQKNAAMVQHYSNRRVWLVEGPSGKQGTRIVAGPLAPGTLPPPGPPEEEHRH